MHFLLFFLAISYCRLSDGATSTKINYLPNGQVEGYELIINNTVQPKDNSPLPRDTVSKIVKHTSTFGNAYTRVDERVMGDNSYLNVHSILKQHEQQRQPQQKIRMKYPVKTVLMVPSVRHANGNSENVKLRFAKVGPYAALIVPVNRSESSGKSELAVPPEIRDSIRAYIEVQQSALAQTNPKNKAYSYAPPIYTNPSGSGPISSHTPPSLNLPNPEKSGHYIYPEATIVGNPTSEQTEAGNVKTDGFVIRVSNPAGGETNTPNPENKYQEFFVPSSAEQLLPEKVDKIIAIPQHPSSTYPKTSQFEEVYSKDDTSFSSLVSPLTIKSPDSAAPATDQTVILNPLENVVNGQKDLEQQHLAIGLSLVETQNPIPEYPFEGPPPGQPEFSDVSPGSDIKDFQIQQSVLETNNNDQISIIKGSDISGSLETNSNLPLNCQTSLKEGHTIDMGACASVLEDSQLEQLPLDLPGSDVSHGSGSKNPEFQQPDLETTNRNRFPVVKESGDTGTLDATYSNEPLRKPTGTDEGQTSNTRTSASAGAQHENFGSTDAKQTSKLTIGGSSSEQNNLHSRQHFKFISQANSVPGAIGSVENFQNTVVRNDASSSATASSSALDGQFQSNAYDGFKASNPVNQFNTFQQPFSSDLGLIKTADTDSQQLNGFQSNAGQNLKEGSNFASTSSDQQFKQAHGKNAKETFTDSVSTAGTHSSSQLNQFKDTPGLHLAQEKPTLVTVNSVQQLGELLNQNSQILNSLGRKNLQLLSDERLKALIQHPSLTTQFTLGSPSGQAAAVLTSTGTHAKIELPTTTVTANTQPLEKIVIPKTFIPLPSKTGSPFGFNEDDHNLQGTAIPLVKDQPTIFGSSQIVQNAASQSFQSSINQQQSNILSNAAGEFNPAANFEPAYAAAAAAAAVAADSEHFNEFGIPNPEANQFSILNTNDQFLLPERTVGITGPHTDEFSGAVSSAAAYSGRLQDQQTLAHFNTGEPSFAHKEQTILASDAAGIYTGQFGHSHGADVLPPGPTQIVVKGPATDVPEVILENQRFSIPKYLIPVPNKSRIPIDLREGIPIYQKPDVAPLEQFGPDVSHVSSSSAAVTDADVAAGNDQYNQFLANSNTGAFLPHVRNQATPAHDHLSGGKQVYDGVSSPFPKDGSTSGNSNLGLQHQAGKSPVNFVLAPDSRPNAALLPTPYGHIPEAAENGKQLEEVVNPKYGLPLPKETGVPVAPLIGGPVLLDRYASGYEGYLTPVTRQHKPDLGVRVVTSQSAPIVGPHTERLLETLNGLLALPKRHTTTTIKT